MYATKLQTKQSNCQIAWTEQGLKTIHLTHTNNNHIRYRICSQDPRCVEDLGGSSALSGTNSKKELLKMESKSHPATRPMSLCKGKK